MSVPGSWPTWSSNMSMEWPADGLNGAQTGWCDDDRRIGALILPSLTEKGGRSKSPLTPALYSCSTLPTRVESSGLTASG